MATSKQPFGYQKNNPLTKYVERVLGINSTQKAVPTQKRTSKLQRKKYRAK
tara:strand:- start:76 stop:228 length:153 start_codon:yes stop_codon:yes gene_type:complete